MPIHLKAASTAAAREQQADLVADQALSSDVASESSAPSPRGATRGRGLPSALRADMESRLGQDFSNVEIRADAEGAALAERLGARALAFGETVYFAGGEFAPESSDGRHLIAHELAHVVQQRSLGRPEVAMQQANGASLQDQARDLRVELKAAKTDAERKPLIERAQTLATQLTSRLATAKATNPVDETAVDNARAGLLHLVRGLLESSEPAASIAIALGSGDTQVQQGLVSQLRDASSGVAGQQSFLSGIAPLAGETMKAGTAAQGRKWLDDNTGTIGKIFAKLDAMGLAGLRRESLGLELSELLLTNYFRPLREDERDPTPDPEGKLSVQRTDASTNQIEADCDVYATYAARLLREQGWETAGYMVIHPTEMRQGSDPPVLRSSHAVAMAKKPNSGGGWMYVGVSDTEIRELVGHGLALSTDYNASVFLLDLALDIYDPKLSIYDAYYLPAGAGGAMDMRLIDPKPNNLTPQFSKS